jgi:hypothetical protein
MEQAKSSDNDNVGPRIYDEDDDVMTCAQSRLQAPAIVVVESTKLFFARCAPMDLCNGVHGGHTAFAPLQCFWGAPGDMPRDFDFSGAVSNAAADAVPTRLCLDCPGSHAQCSSHGPNL